jgi:alpha(1,3/1,4) fucosyltransferase
MAPVNVCAINFWPGFSLVDSFVGHLLKCAFDSFRIVETEHDADIVVSSVFVKEPPQDPRRTVCFIWENVRPDYRYCSYSISSDFDSYRGRNCRVPLWYAELQWPGYSPRRVPVSNNHGFESPVEIDSLLQPRVGQNRDEDLFCCYITNYPELHRLFCVESLSQVGAVDIYGNIVDKPLRASKYDLLRRYRFNLCFENSIFPGYYTEKIIHAWAGGCIPLYYSDNWYISDFNPNAIINRINFSSVDEFCEHVAYVNKSQHAFNEIFDQPLLLKRPTLDPAIDFLRSAHDRIVRDRRGSPKSNACAGSVGPDIGVATSIPDSFARRQTLPPSQTPPRQSRGKRLVRWMRQPRKMLLGLED